MLPIPRQTFWLFHGSIKNGKLTQKQKLSNSLIILSLGTHADFRLGPPYIPIYKHCKIEPYNFSKRGDKACMHQLLWLFRMPSRALSIDFGIWPRGAAHCFFAPLPFRGGVARSPGTIFKNQQYTTQFGEFFASFILLKSGKPENFRKFLESGDKLLREWDFDWTGLSC